MTSPLHTKVVDDATRVHDIVGHHANLLNLFSITCPDKYSAVVLLWLCYLGLFRQLTDLCQSWCQTKDISLCPISWDNFTCFKAYRGNFRSFIAEGLFSAFFKSRPLRTDSLISKWILSGIGGFISPKYQQMSNN